MGKKVKGGLIARGLKAAARIALPKGAEYALGLTKDPSKKKKYRFSINKSINKLIQAKLVAKRMSYKVKLANSVR